MSAASIGSLIRPEDIYLRPEILEAQLGSHAGLDIDQLGAVDVLEEDTTLGEIAFNTRPTLRFHGSIPAFMEQVRKLMAAELAHGAGGSEPGRSGAAGASCCGSISCRTGWAAACSMRVAKRV